MGWSCTAAGIGMSWVTLTPQYRLMLVRVTSSSVSQYKCLSKIVPVSHVRRFFNKPAFLTNFLRNLDLLHASDPIMIDAPHRLVASQR